MMRRSLILTVAVLGMVSVASAQSPAGSWNGKISMKAPDTSKLTAEQKKQTDAMMKQMSAATLKLNIKADKTFSITVPGQSFGGKTTPSSTSTGTWVQSGKAITMTTKKQDGKALPNGKSTPVTMTISADGKTMTMVPPGGGAQGFKVVFTKQ